jgi:hypothetical protein
MIVTHWRFGLRAKELESTQIPGLGERLHPYRTLQMNLMYCTQVNAGNRSMEWNAFYGVAITKIDYQNRLPVHYYDKFVSDCRLKEYNRAYRCLSASSRKANLPGWYVGFLYC